MSESGHTTLRTELAYGLLLLCAALIAALGYGYHEYTGKVANLTQTSAELRDSVARFEALTEERNYIYNTLLSEQDKNKLFENQIKEIAGTVGNLDKLSKTDEELLQKYSRVYFLNEHYVPESLTAIKSDYVFEKTQAKSVHSKVMPYLENMIKAAADNDTPIQVISAYRSFDDQSSLKGRYLVTYGSGSNQFSADQGYSEHQLGTALDLTTPKLGSAYTSFEATQAYAWLQDNAYKYGFILSYPKGNAYYQFEPWHWRFVGTKLAERMHNEGEHFYDLDQREINNYLLTIFD